MVPQKDFVCDVVKNGSKKTYCSAIVLNNSVEYCIFMILNPGNNSVKLGVTGWVPKTADSEVWKV